MFKIYYSYQHIKIIVSAPDNKNEKKKKSLPCEVMCSSATNHKRDGRSSPYLVAINSMRQKSRESKYVCLSTDYPS